VNRWRDFRSDNTIAAKLFIRNRIAPAEIALPKLKTHCRSRKRVVAAEIACGIATRRSPGTHFSQQQNKCAHPFNLM
jgi:hypothetical protein